jgi:ABC-type transport system, involved in lipoprotein release, permease component
MRTALTLAAIMFGVTALIVTGGFVEDTLVQLRESTIQSQLGHLQIYQAGFLKSGRLAPFKYMIEKPENVAAQLRNLPNIIEIMPRITFSGLLSNSRTTVGIIGEGLDIAKEARWAHALKLLSGRQISPKGRYEILLGQGIAQSLKLKPGDRTTILLNTPGGALNSLDFEVVGVFQTFSKDYDDRAVRITLDDAQELLGTTAVHKLVIALKDTVTTDIVADQARQALAQGTFEIRTWHELADFYTKAADLYKRYFVVLKLIVLALVLLGVANTVNLTIYQRTGEFGTLRAVGNRGSMIFRLLFSEYLLVALLGSFGGVVFGVLLALLISLIGIPMPPMPNTNRGYTALIQVVPLEVAQAFVVGLVATLGAAYFPARRASRIAVIEALRHN